MILSTLFATIYNLRERHIEIYSNQFLLTTKNEEFLSLDKKTSNWG
jgi:hypothetical protein